MTQSPKPRQSPFPAPDGVLICEGPLDTVRVMEWLATTMSSGGQVDYSNYEAGEIRMDLKTGRLIRLSHTAITWDELYDRPDVPYDMPWIVEDVLSGDIYERTEEQISQETYNAMETLAWATLDDADLEPAGDS